MDTEGTNINTIIWQFDNKSARVYHHTQPPAQPTSMSQKAGKTPVPVSNEVMSGWKIKYGRLN